MTVLDVPEVARVERRCFTNPWPATAYRRELRLPEQNYYVVLRDVPDAKAGANGGAADPDRGANGQGAAGRVGDGPRVLPRLTLPSLPFGRRQEDEAGRLIGFAGMWVMYDEAHVTTIGVDPDYRGRGLGELLLVALFDEALRRGGAWLTLEVRVTNEPAQALYRKYGFTIHGTRKRYYSDNNEDAYIMWSPSLREPENLARYQELRRAVARRFPILGEPGAGAGGRPAGLQGGPPGRPAASG